MLYSGLVAIGGVFLFGLLLGGLIIGLWMRARLVRLETAKQFADQAAAQLGETFRSLADAALRSNQSAFLDASPVHLGTVARPNDGRIGRKADGDRGRGPSAQRSLERLEVHIRELERARENVFGSLGEQMQTLARETSTLSSALRSPQTRGRWGEIRCAASSSLRA